MSDNLRGLIANIPYYKDQINKGNSIIFKHFIYPKTITAANLVAGASPVSSLDIQADADFVILAQSYVAFVSPLAALTSGTRIIPPVTIKLTDSGSSQQLQSDPVAIDTIFGTGQFPFILPQPYYLSAKSNLQITPTNNDPAVAFYLYLSFIGVKIYVTSAGQMVRPPQ